MKNYCLKYREHVHDLKIRNVCGPRECEYLIDQRWLPLLNVRTVRELENIKRLHETGWHEEIYN